MFADDFVGISEIQEGWQKQIERALEYARKCRVTANNVDTCAIFVCNEDSPGRVQMEVRRRGIADRRPVYIPWRRDINAVLGMDTLTTQ